MDRILYILDQYPSVTETFIQKEMEYMKKYGDQFSLFSFRKGNHICDNGIDILPCTYPKWYNIRIMANVFRYLITSDHKIRLTSKLVSSRHIIEIISKVKKLFLVFNIQELIRINQVSQLHSHFSSYPTDIALLASKVLNIPFSFSAHAHDIFTQNPDQLRIKVRAAKMIVTCTQYNKRFLNNLTPDPIIHKKIYCLYHGVDLNYWQFLDSHLYREREKIRLLCIARLVEKKGVLNLIQAVEKLSIENNDVHCTIIGDGPLKKKLQQEIKQKNLTQQFTLTGFLSRDETKAHFKKNHLLILPATIASNGDMDGLPNVLLEALASGLPVITTPISAIPELISHKKTGMLVTPNNSSQISQCIIELIRKPALYEKIRQNGRNCVENKYNQYYWLQELRSLFCQRT